MSAKRLFPHLHALQLDDILPTKSLVVLTLSSPRRSARCPLCQRRSKSVHSRSTRTAADLPASGRSVVLRLRIRRFRCLTPS